MESPPISFLSENHICPLCKNPIIISMRQDSKSCRLYHRNCMKIIITIKSNPNYMIRNEPNKISILKGLDRLNIYHYKPKKYIKKRIRKLEFKSGIEKNRMSHFRGASFRV